MGVITHHRIGVDRHREGVSQKMDSLLDPLAPVIEILASELIQAAKEGSTNASSYDVKTAEFTGRRDL